MKGNGFRLILTIGFVLLSGYYLYPSLHNFYIQKKLNNLEGEARSQYERENYQKIQNVSEEALKLGLDLQGGMHVALEVRVDELLRALAVDTDATFDEVLALAVSQAQTGGDSIIDGFVSEFERRDPNVRLSRYFRNEAEGLDRRASNADVAAYLKRETDGAVNRAIEIIRQRVDRFGVTEPSIQKQGSRRVIVELPGIDDPERVRKLLRGTARLEFRLMADPDELRQSLQRIIEFYEADSSAVAPLASDTSGAMIASADSAANEADTSFTVGDLAQNEAAPQSTNPLLQVLQPRGESVIFGYVAVSDTAQFNTLMHNPRVQSLLPPNVDLLYTSAPEGTTEEGREVFSVLGVREEVELTGDVITDARTDFSQLGQAEVSMTMNAEGARDWARITGANIDRPIAIVLDNVVYSYPRVINRITGGRSSITGLASSMEAEDVVTILKSGALPAPVDIVEERTVGPSLGAASIKAGLLSVIIGLMIVAVFMIFYYRTAGIVADLALIVNIIFILGILAAFSATLTLPGIAGIVLTIGMAVDANVLIFERIREEAMTGKTLKAAVETGYARAFSAIFDANITTFFVGAILYSFGVGPIQGFAVTLMAGIAASLFSAIIITRIIFDYVISDRRMGVSFG